MCYEWIIEKSPFGLLPKCLLALWPLLAGKESSVVDLPENNALNLQIFFIF
jgi:hypothetical protein